MSKTIQITLKPLDYYFFGTNETFDFGAKGIKNYSVKSNHIPQQTGLLGLLRHAFLAAGYPIGESFNPESEKQDFGSIGRISPQYLIRNGKEIYFKCPLPVQEKNGKATALSFDVARAEAIYNNKQENATYLSTNYDPKNDMLNHWVNIETGVHAEFSEFFIEETHTGIDKGKTIAGRTEDGAFYRQQFYRLKDTMFAFQATVDESIDITRLPRLLPFGGEKRMFSIDYSEKDFKKWELIQAALEKWFSPFLQTEEPCVLLLTDAYVRQFSELEKNLQFAILQAKPFRNIITPKTVTNFSRLGNNPGDGNQLFKPDKTTYLLKQGSLVFASEENKPALPELLDEPVFYAAGYNYFIKNF